MLQDIGYLCSSKENYFNAIKSTFIADFERLLLEYPNLPANGFDEYQKELHPVYSYYLIKDYQLGDSSEKGVLMHNEMYQYSNQGALKTNLKDFYNTLDRASLLTQSKDKNIIDMEINGNSIIIKASSLEMGKVEEKMTVENETNNNLKISFSAKYMLEALKMFNSEEIYILLNGEINPIILKEIDKENIIQLILPMKTY